MPTILLLLFIFLLVLLLLLESSPPHHCGGQVVRALCQRSGKSTWRKGKSAICASQPFQDMGSHTDFAQMHCDLLHVTTVL
ncbi:hypothetical protein BX600DRAFT_451001 [Xylariales sp. PMI_506]|nr:hypothetical protein BX600DRAFT_451001 [Xylariales sp. PMI_506]